MGIPNKNNKVDYYSIKYDSTIEDESMSHYTTQIPNKQSLKKLLKEAFVRADEMNYRFVPIREKNRNTAPQKAIETHTLLIPGILQERLATSKTTGTSNDNDSDDSVSNDGSHCDMEESAFHIDPVEEDQDEDDVDIFGRD